jgi:hypothetical protein
MATRLTYTVQIDGEVIGRFGSSEDALFFATAANEAGLFELTNPGHVARAYDPRGALIEVPPYRTR